MLCPCTPNEYLWRESTTRRRRRKESSNPVASPANATTIGTCTPWLPTGRISGAQTWICASSLLQRTGRRSAARHRIKILRELSGRASGYYSVSTGGRDYNKGLYGSVSMCKYALSGLGFQFQGDIERLACPRITRTEAHGCSKLFYRLLDLSVFC